MQKNHTDLLKHKCVIVGNLLATYRTLYARMINIYYYYIDHILIVIYIMYNLIPLHFKNKILSYISQRKVIRQTR